MRAWPGCRKFPIGTEDIQQRVRLGRQCTRDIPQNVNFAVSAWSARAFLDAYNVPYETAPAAPKLEARDVAAQAREFTVLVECWK